MKDFYMKKKEASITNRNQFLIFHSVYNLNKKDFFLKLLLFLSKFYWDVKFIDV